MEDSKINPAQILISDYLELKHLEPRSEEWGSATFKKNPPRFYRLERIKSCLRALGMHPIPIMKFENGEFLIDRDLNELYEVERILLNAFNLDYDSFVQERGVDQLPHLFSGFLNLLINLNKVRKTFSGTLAASDHYLTPIFAAKQITEKNEGYEETIKDALVFLLNSANKTFTEKEMVEKYDFPDVDLLDVDLEWM